MKKLNLEYDINKGEGAFYGPKIEFVLDRCIIKRMAVWNFTS